MSSGSNCSFQTATMLESRWESLSYIICEINPVCDVTSAKDAGRHSIPPCVGGPGFLLQKASKHASSRALWLTGIVEADDTYVPESRKGARSLERKARRRAGRSGGRASKRGLSDEQVPVRVAADCSDATVSAVLPAVNADTLADTLPEVIAPVVDENIVLLTDGHRAYPGCATATGAHHEALNLSRRERVRGTFHIQAVNNRHSRLKDFLRCY